MSRITALLVSCILICWSPVRAGDVAFSKEYDRCVGASGGVTVAINDCTNAETDRWDKRLNAAYRGLLATLSPQRQKALMEAEVAWMKFRDTNCRFIADPDGGTAAGMAGYSCILRMTAERALELESFKSN